MSSAPLDIERADNPKKASKPKENQQDGVQLASSNSSRTRER